jgi:16S rRNA (cytosine1402-N4)-methyltransferase
MEYHTPVLLNEVVAHLQVKKGQKYIDATLGDGGHTIELLKKGAIVLGIDVDANSLERATQRINDLGFAGIFSARQGNFAHLEELAKPDFSQVHGVIFDLGYSSTQLEQDPSGLSFTHDQPLDMRLDKTLGVTAADLVNALSEKELADLIYTYSDERLAKRFAKAIVEARSTEKLQTTAQLAKVIADAAPSGYERGRINPATRTFQALRIVVNDEIENLKKALPQAARLLLPGGRLSVLAFHSLEDRVAKEFGNSAQPWIKPVTKKPVTPSEEEVKANPRARSAKLRTYERCSNKNTAQQN